MKSNSIILASLFCLLSLSGLKAEYSDPVLRVLLFQTSQSVVIQDNSGLHIEGVRLKSWESSKITLRPIDSKTIRINERIDHKGALYISSNSYLSVKKAKARTPRRYSGMIEVRPYSGGVYVINHVPTEHYLEGVLNAEISTKWNLEVVKAQSVISRTFALFKMNKRRNHLWHLASDHSDQVYQGVNISDARGRQAIRSTKGLVVSYRGSLAQTFYHSNCGGMTEDPGNVWQYSVPYLGVKNVPYGQNDPRYLWETTFSDRELKKIMSKAGIPSRSLDDLVISQRTSSNRAYELLFYSNRAYPLLASEFRKLAGYSRVQSLLFDVIRVPGGYKLRGKGNGHGVGLCQWAAKEMADRGYDFEDILHYFYTPVSIARYNG